MMTHGRDPVLFRLGRAESHPAACSLASLAAGGRPNPRHGHRGTSAACRAPSIIQPRLRTPDTRAANILEVTNGAIILAKILVCSSSHLDRSQRRNPVEVSVQELVPPGLSGNAVLIGNCLILA